MTSSVEVERLGRSFRLSLDIEAHGPGLTISRGRAGIPSAGVASSMPIDEEELVHRMTFYVRRRVPQPLRMLVGRILVAAAARELERDIPIWESKICLPRPMLCDVDGPIVRYRTWARQFDDDDAAAN